MSTSRDLSMGQRADGTWVMTAAGEIDMSKRRPFRGTPGPGPGQSRDGPGALVMDLRTAESLDPAGLATLFAYAPEVELIASPPLAPVLTISGLADLVTVHGLAGGPGR